MKIIITLLLEITVLMNLSACSSNNISINIESSVKQTSSDSFDKNSNNSSDTDEESISDISNTSYDS